ncbi:hypothetical protein LOK49_LG04G03780 [Camellia lanceoleosa]|uniref:Uncharacterized protein n=1 Tax=Camellia lanceoleosa TaxID=1840588 RepID=A0ACC0I318_9ERIC|nr:hypothetical protein LOK49_LG04G03780 [Camellia lanceoleosa]
MYRRVKIRAQCNVKEVIISCFILIEQGKATRQDLDLRCKELINEEFGERCNFDVDDAVQKLEKLGIVAPDSIGRYYCVSLKRANDIIGTTTEELVLEAKQSAIKREREQLKAKLQMRQECAIKRERTIAHSLSQQQLKSNPSSNSRTNKLVATHKLDKHISRQTYRMMEESEATSHPIFGSSAIFSKLDSVEVKQNSLSTRIIAKPPMSGQTTHSSSDPCSEFLFDESTTSRLVCPELKSANIRLEGVQTHSHVRRKRIVGMPKQILFQKRYRTAMMAVKPQEPGAGNGKDHVSKEKSLK